MVLHGFESLFAFGAGGDAAVKLMKRPFAGERDEHGFWQLNRAFVQVEVALPAAGFGEAGVVAAQSIPDVARQGQYIAFAQGFEVTAGTGAREAGNLEQAVAVCWPLNVVQQCLFVGLVVAFQHRFLLHFFTEVVARHGHNRIRVQAFCGNDVTDHSWRHHARTVNHHCHHAAT